MHQQVLIAFFAYFSVLLAIGFLAHRKQKTSKDFIMGGRSLSYWVTAFSAHASDMSSWLFMAFPAALFTQGLSASWIAIGLLGGMYLNWQLVSKRLRVQTEKYNSYTLSTFFEKRFHDTSGVIRILTAVMALFFLTSYLAAGLIAMGYLLEALFGIDYYIGLTIAMAVATAYTFVGGFYTVAKVDQFQALFLIVMISIVPFIAYFYLPEGFASIEAAAGQQQISLALLPDHSFITLISILFLALGWGLGYFGQPHVITKFMGIDNPADLKKSKYVGMTWQFISLFAAASVGLVGLGLFDTNLQNPELVFVDMVDFIFNPFLKGFILCGVIAANMSTMDSQILVCASIASEDLYKHLVHKKASEKQLLKVSRVSLVLVSCISLLLAYVKSSTVLEAVLYAWSGLGSSFGPLVLVSLYSKKANKYGAIAGIVIGGSVAALWPSLNPYLTRLIIPPMIPGFFLGLGAIFLVSRLTRHKMVPAHGE